MKTKILVMIFLLSAYSIFSDMGPYNYTGKIVTISTFIKNTDIKMKSETIDIYADPIQREFSKTEEYRCKVVAKFFMENTTNKNISLKVGFPAGYYFEFENERLAFISDIFYNFKVKSDDKNISKINYALVVPPNNKEEWITWDNDFKPGITKVEIEYETFSISSYKKPYFQNIYYTFATGSLWKDKIDSAKLTIHFKDDIYDEQIMSGTTIKNYSIDKNKISWIFKDYKPTLNDTVQLEFIPLDIFKDIISLRDKIKSNPNDSDAKIELAELYLIANIRINEFEEMLKSILKRDPKKSRAWNFLISNYYFYNESPYLIEYNNISEEHSLLIKEAYKNCPNNEGIKNWYELAFMDERQIPEKIYFSLLGKNDNGYDLNIAHDIGGTLSNDDFFLLLKYYEFENKGIYEKVKNEKENKTLAVSKNGNSDFLLFLKKTDVSKKDKTKIINILNSIGYKYFYLENIYKYNNDNNLNFKMKKTPSYYLDVIKNLINHYFHIKIGR